MVDLLQADTAPLFSFDAPGLSIVERSGLTAAYVMARRGQAEALASRVLARFGVVPPTAPKAAGRNGVTFVWAGPGQWLAIGENTPDLYTRLQPVCADAAALSEQSDGRLLFRLSGRLAPALLARGCPLDLHPRAFGPQDAALTKIGLIGAHVWQVDDTPSYDLAIMRSFAGSFRDWLLEAARSAIL